MYGALFGAKGPAVGTGYANSSPANVEYRLKLALDREDRLNAEEHKVYEQTSIELEFGKTFYLRAHP